MKIIFDHASESEKEQTLAILREKFSAQDSSMKFNPMVRKGLVSDVVSFYVESKQILPTGFLLYLKAYLRKANIEFEVKDLRKFPEPDQKFINKKRIKLGSYEGRDYQIDAVRKLVNTGFGICKSATGTGKGWVIAALFRAYPKSKFLCLFNSIDLVLQTRDILVNKYGFKESEVGVIQGNNFEDDKRITLLSIMSYEKAFHLFPDIDVIVLDEAHVTGRNPTSEKIIFCCQNASAKFGFSATPDVIDNPVEQLRLYGTIGPVVYKNEISEKIDDGTLAKVNLKIYKVKCDPVRITGSYNDIYETVKIKNNKEEYAGWEIIKKDGNEYARRFVELGDESTHYICNDIRNNMIAKHARENKRVLVLFNKIEHGKRLKELLPEAILVSGEDDAKAREEAKKHLANNDNSIVIASTIFNVGVDIPAIKTYINAGAGRSAIATIQKLGRATRKDEKTNKVSALVIDYDDSMISPLGKKQTNRRIFIYNKLNLPIEFI